MKAKLLLFLIGSVLGILLPILFFENRENARYEEWRAKFTNYGFLNTLTIPSLVPDLLWEYRPNSEYQGVTTNSFGFRDREDVRLEKSSGVRRLAFAGDSVTAAWRLPRELGFVAQTQALLQSRGISAETLDFAVDGYNATQVRSLISNKILPFSPDVIVYTLCLNDFDYSDSSGEKIRYFKKPESFFLERLERLRFSWSQSDFVTYAFNKNKLRVFGEIETMQTILATRKTPFLVAIVPAFSPSEDYPYRSLHEELKNFLRAKRISVVDTLPWFQAEKTALSSFALDLWHPNPAGHKVLARGFAELLQEPHKTTTKRKDD